MDSTILECHSGIQIFAVVILVIPVHGIECKYVQSQSAMELNPTMKYVKQVAF